MEYSEYCSEMNPSQFGEQLTSRFGRLKWSNSKDSMSSSKECYNLHITRRIIECEFLFLVPLPRANESN